MNLERYDRQMRLPEVGEAGQQSLSASVAVLVGVGGLGAPAALYLAAAGVGTLRLVDFDRVDRSNLHRQVLYTEADVGRPKVEAAADRLRERNPDIQVETINAPFGPDNAFRVLQGADVVLDGTDAFATRYLVNDAAHLCSVPNVFASVSSFDIQSFVSAPGGPCYRCVFPEPPPAHLAPSCAEAGVLGVVPGLAGMIQATEALKVLLCLGDLLVGRLLVWDLLTMRSREIIVETDPDCPLCGDNPEIETFDDAVRLTEAVCGPLPVPVPTLTVRELKARLDAGERPFLLDVRSADEHAFADIGGSALIPLPELATRLGELEGVDDLVVYCRSGARSATAVSLLERNGIRATNLQGGILAWSDEIDPSVPTY
ncbi:MAG: ThiF family adenylyltransferase [Bacteroidota bacterium]